MYHNPFFSTIFATLLGKHLPCSQISMIKVATAQMWFHYIYINESLYISNEILQHVGQLVFIRDLLSQYNFLAYSMLACSYKKKFLFDFQNFPTKMSFGTF